MLYNLIQSIRESDVWADESRRPYIRVINTNKTPLRERLVQQLPEDILVTDILQSSKARGHTSKYYNEAIVSGFDSLKKPQLEWLVTIQADTVLCKDWYASVEAAMQTCDFFQHGAGDQFVAYKPTAISEVGLWDELYFGIAGHEGDYFLRAAMILGARACINDHHHGRVNSPSPSSISDHITCNSPDTGFHRNDNPSRAKSQEYYDIFAKPYFLRKWSACGYSDTAWPVSPPPMCQPNIEEINFYPHFME